MSDKKTVGETIGRGIDKTIDYVTNDLADDVTTIANNPLDFANDIADDINAVVDDAVGRINSNVKHISDKIVTNAEDLGITEPSVEQIPIQDQYINPDIFTNHVPESITPNTTNDVISAESISNMKEVLINLNKSPQLANMSNKVFGVDTAAILSDGELTQNEFIALTANMGNSMIKHGFIDKPNSEETEGILSQAETDGMNIEAQDAIGIAAINSISNSPEMFTALKKSVDLYCKQTGETNGICYTFGNQVDQPIVEERNPTTGEEVEILGESPVLNHNPDDYLPKKIFIPDDGSGLSY